jgi:hypothetical protein
MENSGSLWSLTPAGRTPLRAEPMAVLRDLRALASRRLVGTGIMTEALSLYRCGTEINVNPHVSQDISVARTSTGAARQSEPALGLDGHTWPASFRASPAMMKKAGSKEFKDIGRFSSSSEEHRGSDASRRIAADDGGTSVQPSKRPAALCRASQFVDRPCRSRGRNDISRLLTPCDARQRFDPSPT